MKPDEMFDATEELLLDILARIDDGEEEALDDLKRLKRYVAELNDLMSVISEDDDMESIQRKFEELNEKFEEFLMAVVKVVG
jgi:hypothetical protein